MENIEISVGKTLRYLARNKQARVFFKENEWLYRGLLNCAKRYIAGEERAEALEKAFLLQQEGYGISLEYMGGEDTNSVSKCEKTVKEFINLIIQTNPIISKPNICFDLSVMGMSISNDIALSNLSKIASIAKHNHAELIISMEESAKTDKIIEIHQQICQVYDNVGLTIQAYLHRTPADLRNIVNLPGKIRLVKGVYDEPGSISLQRSKELNCRYIECMDFLQKTDKSIIIGTHDEVLINQMIDKGLLDNSKVVLEMLHGVRPDLLRKLKNQGVPVSVCLAYGRDWYLHLLHRCAEFPPNIFKAVIDFIDQNQTKDPYYF